MNHIYRIIWNRATACYQAVTESAKGQGKHAGKSTTVVQGGASSGSLSGTLPPASLLTASAMAAALCIVSLNSLAGPVGGQVTAGSATINQTGSVGKTATTINQTSHKAAIDWSKFSVGANESVRFNQPGSSAVTLNRVTGTEASAIMGKLSANGQVFILNPNGILFGAGSQVNVGSLVASTLKLDNANFMAGNYKFTGDANGNSNSTASVINNGSITVAPGGTLALMAPVVQNTGTLSAPSGNVLLAGAQAVTLTLQTDGGLVAYTLDEGSVQALVDNGGLIQANGGHVVLTAKGVDALSKAVVNHSGVIEAQTVDGKSGVIELLGDMQSGTVNVSGKLDASAPNTDGKGGDGGFIDTSAANVQIAEGAQITTKAAAGKTGLWLIDPTDYTIFAGSGATSSSMGATTLTDYLVNTDITIATSATGTGNGDIFVNSPVTWSANKLTLSAHRNININANLTASGTASLDMKYGADYILNNNSQINLPSGNSLTLQNNAYFVVNTLAELQGLNNGSASGAYALGSNIDASATATGAGFDPLVFDASKVPGWNSSYGIPNYRILDFHGLGHSITNFHINRPLEDNVGLFGTVTSGQIRDLNLSGSVVGKGNVGALVGLGGYYPSGNVFAALPYQPIKITNVHGDVTVSGINAVGGAVGLVGYANISNVSVKGDINGVDSVGGIAGGIVFNSNINKTQFAGNVSASSQSAGGLVGTAYLTCLSYSCVYNNQINDSFANANVVSSGIYAGGLVGYGQSLVISNNYALGEVSANSYAGGLAGVMKSGYYGGISNSYANNNVASGGYVGGLIGIASIGYVNYAPANFQVNSSYYNEVNSNIPSPAGNLEISYSGYTNPTATATDSKLTTAQMSQQSTYTGWDFVNTWVMLPGASYPTLRSNPAYVAPVVVTPASPTTMVTATVVPPEPIEVSIAGSTTPATNLVTPVQPTTGAASTIPGMGDIMCVNFGGCSTALNTDVKNDDVTSGLIDGVAAVAIDLSKGYIEEKLLPSVVTEIVKGEALARGKYYDSLFGMMNNKNLDLTAAERRAIQSQLSKQSRAWYTEASVAKTTVSNSTSIALGIGGVVSVFADAYEAYKVMSEIDEFFLENPTLRNKLPTDVLSQFITDSIKDIAIGSSTILLLKAVATKFGEVVAKNVGRSLGVVFGVLSDPGAAGEAATQSIPLDSRGAISWAKSNTEFAASIEIRCGSNASCIEQGASVSKNSPMTGMWEFYSIKRDYLKTVGADTSAYDWVDKYRKSSDGNQMIPLYERVNNAV